MVAPIDLACSGSSQEEDLVAMEGSDSLYCDGEHDWFPRDEFKDGVHVTASPQHYRIGGAPIGGEILPPAAPAPPDLRA